MLMQPVHAGALKLISDVLNLHVELAIALWNHARVRMCVSIVQYYCIICTYNCMHEPIYIPDSACVHCLYNFVLICKLFTCMHVLIRLGTHTGYDFTVLYSQTLTICISVQHGYSLL